MPRVVSPFVNDDVSFSRKLEIPRSCIEGAEFIIRCIASNDYGLVWKNGKAEIPYVFASFAAGRNFNVSKDKNFVNNTDGLQDYSFPEPLTLGQGIILLNKTDNNEKYNMHLGALVASDDRFLYFSDVSDMSAEDSKAKVIKTLNWNVKRVMRLTSFRGTEYQTGNFVMGILTANNPI